jgi:hypothetical protein
MLKSNIYLHHVGEANPIVDERRCTDGRWQTRDPTQHAERMMVKNTKERGRSAIRRKKGHKAAIIGYHGSRRTLPSRVLYTPAAGHASEGLWNLTQWEILVRSSSNLPLSQFPQTDIQESHVFPNCLYFPTVLV